MQTPEPVASQSKAPTAPATVKEQEPVAPQHTQPTGQVANPKPQTTAVTSQELVKPQTVQPTAPVKASEPAASQPTQTTVQVTDPKQTTTTAPAKTPEPVASQSTKPTELPKLSDVIPTSKVWISGLIGNRQIDCLGPIEIPLKIDEPTYPFTPVPANSDYTNQVFDYDTSAWVPTDAKSQGQQLTDLTKEVADLQREIIKNGKDAEQYQKASIQQMQMLTSIASKLDVLTKKDGIK